MNCPGCGKDESRSLDTRCFDGKTILRRRECSCGGRWSTEEVIIRSTFTTTTRCKPAASPLQADRNPAATAFLSLFPDSGSSPGLEASDPDQTRVERSADFDSWWAAYPRKVGKLAAEAIWRTRKPKMPGLPEMLETLAWQSDEWAKGDPKYIPHPERYLKNGRWTDVRPAPSRAPVVGHYKVEPGKYYPSGEQDL